MDRFQEWLNTRRKRITIPLTESLVNQYEDSPYAGIAKLAQYYFTLKASDRKFFFAEFEHAFQDYHDLINLDRYSEFERFHKEHQIEKPQLKEPSPETLKKVLNAALNQIEIFEARLAHKSNGIVIPLNQIELQNHATDVIDPLNRIKSPMQQKRIDRLKAKFKKKPRWEVE